MVGRGDWRGLLEGVAGGLGQDWVRIRVGLGFALG